MILTFTVKSEQIPDRNFLVLVLAPIMTYRLKLEY